MDIEAELVRLQTELLSHNQWLSRKVDPKRRMDDHAEYLNRLFPELVQGNGLAFLDIGCGPGESLYVAQLWHHYAMGIETPVGAGGMGDDYVQYAIRNHILKGLNVVYGPACNVINALPDSRFDCVNMRGSFEQVFSHVMNGIPHDHHHKASFMIWDLNRAPDELERFSSHLKRIMVPDGHLVIHFNGSANHEEFRSVFMSHFCDGKFEGTWLEPRIFDARRSVL